MNNNEFKLEDTIEVICEVLDSGGEFKFEPKGISMLPLIVGQRDSVVMEKFDPLNVKKYDILFYRRSSGQFVLHRLFDIRKDGSYVFCGDNQTDLEYGITPDAVIAKITRLYRKNKLCNLKGFGYRTYVFFWCCMPVRKLVFFPRRCISAFKRIFLKR